MPILVLGESDEKREEGRKGRKGRVKAGNDIIEFPRTMLPAYRSVDFTPFFEDPGDFRQAR